MKKVIIMLFLAVAAGVLPAFAANDSASLTVKAQVTPVFSVNMTEPDTFNIVGNNSRLIPSKQIGSPVVVSNYSSWKISVDSTHKASSTTGRLKLDDAETYIPYSFALTDGATTILSSFGTASAAQSITTRGGKAFGLYFNFESDDTTLWPQGIYRDTVILAISTD
ncbi:spore coat protein U domain-containing protein [bacterium]|nr:spore coat protein U domain-containing protein [bacterium]